MQSKKMVKGIIGSCLSLVTLSVMAAVNVDSLPLEKLKTDVVVVGGGATGMAAAASAAEHGAKVILLEKLFMVGGSSALSGGAIAAGDTKWQHKNGVNIPAQGFADQWLKDQENSVPGAHKDYPNEKAVRKITDQFTQTIDWLDTKVGAKFAKPRPFGWGGPDYAHAPAQMPVPPSGRGSLETGGRFVIASLKDYGDKLGVQYKVNTPAYELLTDKAGNITGILAHDKSKRYEISAPAVILASGGFAKNYDMVKERVPVFAQYVKNSVATAGDTGDGIKMGLKVGAVEPKDSWVIGLFLTAVDPKLTNTFRTKYGYKDCTFVNQDGKRFVKEDLSYVTDHIAEQKSAWALVDSSDPEKVKPLESVTDKAIAVKGNTVEELAKNLGASPKNLKAVFDQVNEAAATGDDKVFHKEKMYIHGLTKAPFYAVRVIPVTGGTMGGLVTDDHFRVLDKNGKPIKGLYAGGEMANRQFYNRTYSSGSSLAIALTSGRIAGETAAEQAK